MGIPAESPMMRNRPGIALAAALFGIVVVGLLTAGVFAMTDLDTRATRNREDAALAARIAQSGMTHAVSIMRNQTKDTSFTRLLRGFDNDALNTADNGLFINYPGLNSSNDIPATGRSIAGGTYWVQILNDEQEAATSPYADNNWRILLRCTGVTARGSRAVIDAVVRLMPPVPGIAFNGNLNMQGGPTAMGACGDIHANGDVHLQGNIRVNAYLSRTGSVSGPGNVLDVGGANVGTTVAPGPLDIPPMSATDECPSAQYLLQADGNIIRRSDGASYNATGSYIFGWRRTSGSPVLWESNSSIVSGTFCVQGNVTVSGSPGSSSSPLPVGIYATGSINVSGNPNIQSYGANNVVMLADGDLWVRGNPGTSYHGILYGGSNCQVSGNPYLTGQFLCQSGPLPSGAMDIVPVNLIEGNPTFNYGCQFQVENDRYRITSWYQRFDL